MSTRTGEVAIIGGGITGLSTAYFLAAAGHKDIVLLEKDLLAQASTGLCVGGIRQQFSHPTNILLSRETLSWIREQEKDPDTGELFHRVGYLFLAQTQKTWESFEQSVGVQHRLSVPVEVLSPEEIKRRWPYLEVYDLEGGTFCPEDGYADPYQVAMLLARKARARGVAILEKTEITGIQQEKGGGYTLETTNGRVSAPFVVNAAGAWSQRVARMVGIELPVRPYRRQVFATAPFPDLPGPVPMIIDQDKLAYFRGDGPGILMGMSDPSEPPSFDTHVDRSFLERVVAACVHRAPVLAKAKVSKGWAGLYAITPDENPIIGEIPGRKGFLCAAGFSGHGFQHGPAVGRVLSELIRTGRTRFDLKPFAFERFAQGQTTSETRTV